MTICIRCGVDAVDSIRCGDPCCSGCTHPDPGEPPHPEQSPSALAGRPDTTKTTPTPSGWSWLTGKKGSR